MTDRLTAPLHLSTWLLCMPLFWACAVQAQGLRATGQLSLPRTATAAPAPAQATADYIVALVNSEPVTNNEVRQRLLRVEQQLAQRGGAMPARDVLAREVLEQIINERAQLQQATELGITVDEAAVTQAELAIAAQNQLSPEALRQRIAAEGMDINQLRNELRNQILLQRVRERQVDARVRVTDADVDDFIREQQGSNDLASLELNLAHVLVAVPEGASEQRVQELQARAQGAADRARAGTDFAALARELSDAPEGASGGQFGMRAANRLPTLFVDATRSLNVGAVAGPLRSPAGFHVLKVIEKRQAGLPDAVITQTRTRHILLRTTAQLSEADAVARLAGYRQQVASGQATFEALAREHSQDGSASQGGDLGWANPGQFVPEFEEAMNKLQPGEMSAPLVSRFGVHLIRVEERRQTQLSRREQRDMVRAMVREEKVEEALRIWAQDVRGRAFVEYREAPQP
ncbi:MAG: peptidylprolyl isomerase [Hydrogenophaga sp.]|jgi:peptidyl-prolyl cis-trans isomerase SurA|uniref:peptidylprolyl isomerase n=1 Tax=Hydrogenophaga sp. TaxID=1904254 RepID=UPI002634D2E9|nr:peptidylprolyl isomerase [Hydrogenophaga sp.]MCV0438641.1 peptidylprolyl isomerase [Hydrogenophaga sp.]